MIILADKQPRCTRLRPEAAMLFKKRNPRPTAEEAARRLLALKCVTVDAHAAPPAEMLERFEPDWTEIQRCEFAQEEAPPTQPLLGPGPREWPLAGIVAVGTQIRRYA